MFIKKFIKKFCAIATAGVIGLTLAISPVASDLKITTVVEAAQQKMSPAEQELNDYLSNHSLKELNKTEEGQRLMHNYFREKKGVSNDLTIAINILLLQIAEKTTTMTYHFKKSTT